MKISLNEESLEAINEYANTIPKVLDNILNDTNKLLQTYNSLYDDLGVHAPDFKNLLLQVKKVHDNTSDSIKELSYMLKSVATKMDAYIHHGVTDAAQMVNTRNIQDKYLAAVNKRFSSQNTNEVVKGFYEEYKSCIKIADYDYINTPHYNYLTNSIYLNAMADMNNPTGNYSTYFHEVGHLMDQYAGNGHTWLSSDAEYGECLRNDVDNYIQKVMINCHCEMTEAYDIISEEISGCLNSSVSDIFGSLTGCVCQGDWGHTPGYWKKDPSNYQKEAFANMFESSVGSKEKVELMEKYFPTAYKRFITIIKER